MKKPISVPKKLVNSIEFAGIDECWNWKMVPTTAGYGLFTIGKNTWGRAVQFLAHRFVFELTNGKIPEGKVLCHSCDNPRCVNPRHLFIGTQRDNYLDSVSKGRSKAQTKTHCSQGHPWSPAGNGCHTCKQEWRASYRMRNRSALAFKQRERARRIRQARRLALSAQ